MKRKGGNRPRGNGDGDVEPYPGVRGVVFMKILIIPLILVLILSMSGCSQEVPLQDTVEEAAAADEFTGKYSGEAGSLTFKPGGTLLIEFTGEFTQYLKEYPNNTSYAYAFKDGQEVLPPEEASAIHIFEKEGDEFSITYFGYDWYEDKIVIFPNSDFEEIFYKE